MEIFFKITGTVILLFLAISDIRRKKIRAFTTVIFGCTALICRGNELLPQALMGAVPGMLILILHRISHGQIGIGDGVMLMGMGLYLGGNDSLKVFILSLCLIFIYSCAGLMLKRLSRHTQLPFAPFYLAAYLGVMYL